MKNIILSPPPHEYFIMIDIYIFCVQTVSVVNGEGAEKREQVITSQVKIYFSIVFFYFFSENKTGKNPEKNKGILYTHTQTYAQALMYMHFLFNL